MPTCAGVSTHKPTHPCVIAVHPLNEMPRRALAHRPSLGGGGTPGRERSESFFGFSPPRPCRRLQRACGCQCCGPVGPRGMPQTRRKSVNFVDPPAGGRSTRRNLVSELPAPPPAKKRVSGSESDGGFKFKRRKPAAQPNTANSSKEAAPTPASSQHPRSRQVRACGRTSTNAHASARSCAGTEGNTCRCACACARARGRIFQCQGHGAARHRRFGSRKQPRRRGP